MVGAANNPRLDHSDSIIYVVHILDQYPDSKVHGANMGPI